VSLDMNVGLTDKVRSLVPAAAEIGAEIIREWLNE